MHNSYNQFLFHKFFCLLYMFRTNLVVHHQEHKIMYNNEEYNSYNRAVNIVLFIIVHYFVLLMMNG